MRSQREGNFLMYVEALGNIIPDVFYGSFPLSSMAFSTCKGPVATGA